MTYRDYYHNMQALCFRAVMALSIIGDDGMKDFYFAANEGFLNQFSKMPAEDALQTINQSQTKQYLTTKEFVESKELEAAECIKNTAEEFEKKKVISDNEQGFKDLQEILGNNQPYEDYIDKIFTDDNFKKTVLADAKKQEKEEAMLYKKKQLT